MALSGSRTFVGFGFGAIQSGLFLSEAFRSGGFGRLVVAEILPDVVACVRDAGGQIRVNIAHQDRIEIDLIDSIEIEDPAAASDRQRLIDAIAVAEEIATAVPSVEFYSSAGQASLDRILAAGLCKKAEIDGPRAVVYTAENHNQAAEMLEELVFKDIPKALREDIHARVQFLNTVIGKMSQVVSSEKEINERGLATMTPGSPRSFLVESYNKIFISKVQFFEPFHRGIHIFEEKDNLIPFQEAKLYGHNAVHALAGYLGKQIGVRFISDVREIPGMVPFLYEAFIEESGQSLIRKHSGSDPLFTTQGFNLYAENLLERMTNPLLMDSVERVTRDARRKLGWNDRMIGTIRLALAQGVEPIRFAFGACAAIASLDASIFNDERSFESLLISIWPESKTAHEEKEQVIALIRDAMQKLKHWRDLEIPKY